MAAQSLATPRPLAGMARLTRWQEHLVFTIPVTLLGVNLAVARQPGALDMQSAVIVLANILAVTFAFMINDLEDADDDAADPNRAQRNAIVCGDVSRRDGWWGTLLAGGLALALYALTPPLTFWTGCLTLALAALYSWRPVRLKALPVIDVVSHVLMLSALLCLAGFFVYASAPGTAWWAVAGVALVSGYGQLYNQLRDYDQDRLAGLRNSAALLGRDWTRRLMYAAMVLAVGCLLITIGQGLWPLWLAGIPAVCAPAIVWRRSSADLRGTAVVDFSGRYQLGLMLVASLMMIAWLGRLAVAPGG